jgi:KAP-like P-loop domain-containing protein
MKLSDRAIADRSHDVLGRWGIATSIYDLIADSRTDSALRIGIYGSWGEGKTSVLRLVESLCVKNNIPVCWFSVWAAQSQADLWARLFDALQSLPQRRDRLGTMKSAAAKLLSRTAPLADLDKYAKAAHSLAKLANLEVGAKDVERVIAKLNANTRVVVLVDDVDRVDSPLVPKLLMGLHDLFDELDRCAFVIALDPTVVSGGLSEINPAWSSAPVFLEKIVQYPFRLPRPTQDQMQRLVVETLNESRLNLPHQAILDVLDLLPPNPRKVKQFIRSLQRLQPTLARMGDDEWNPTLLLLLELLRTASPEVADELLQNRTFLQELVMGMVFHHKGDMHENDKITKEQYSRIMAAVTTTLPHAPKHEQARVQEEITEIASSATERLALVMPEDAMRHVRLEHEPPIITLREFDAFAEAWGKDPSDSTIARLLTDFAKAVGRPESEMLEACAVALLKRRADSIAQASDAFDRIETQQSLARIQALSSLLERLIVAHKLLEDGRVTSRVTIFLTMRTQTADFTNRLAYDVYAPVRDSLRDQLYRATPYLRDRAVDVLKEFKPWERLGLPQNTAGIAELRELRERLVTMFSEYMCESVLDRFMRPGGVAALGSFSRSPVELWLLLSQDSVLHQSDCRARLLAISQEKDDAVAQNFFVYLQMLAGEAGGVTQSALAADPGLIVPAWQAAARVRPQPSMQGQVVELAKRLREALNDDRMIPMPSWVTDTQEGNVESSSADDMPS